jgi:hypothetical protein
MNAIKNETGNTRVKASGTKKLKPPIPALEQRSAAEDDLHPFLRALVEKALAIANESPNAGAVNTVYRALAALKIANELEKPVGKNGKALSEKSIAVAAVRYIEEHILGIKRGEKK